MAMEDRRKEHRENTVNLILGIRGDKTDALLVSPFSLDNLFPGGYPLCSPSEMKQMKEMSRKTSEPSSGDPEERVALYLLDNCK